MEAFMKNKKTIFFIMALLVLFTSAVSQAFYDRRFVPLKDPSGAGGSGEITIERQSFMYGQRSVGVNVFRLKPNSTYTVWVYNEMPAPARQALGIDVNDFRTDGAGNGRYVTTSNEYDLNYWRFIDIYYHPDNDPKNTRDMVLALRGDLKYGWHS